MSKSTLALVMKIGYAYGGAERRLVRILNEINCYYNRFNCKILLYGNKEGIEIIMKDEIKNKTETVVFKNSKQCFAHIFRQKNIIVWYFNLDPAATLYTLLPRKKNQLAVQSIVGINVCRFIYRFLKEKIKYFFTLNRVDWIDCLYPASLKYFNDRRYNNVSATPCPFTDLDQFKPLKKENIIVFAARLAESKNIELVLEAINIVKNDLIKLNYKVKFCGDGPLRDYVINFIESNNLNCIIDCCGHVNMKEVFPYSKIFLSLQPFGNYPSQSLLESISSGNYVLVSNVYDQDIEKITNDSFCSFVNLTAKEVANGIIKAIEFLERDVNDSVVTSARLFAEEHFDIKLSTRYFFEIFDRLEKKYIL